MTAEQGPTGFYDCPKCGNFEPNRRMKCGCGFAASVSARDPNDPGNRDPNDPGNPDEFAAYFARVKKFATLAGVLGGIGGLCFSVAYLMRTENPMMRGVVAMPIGCALGVSAMITGITLLFAPASFFKSDKGDEYMKMIGTRSIPTARAVIVVFLIIGLGIFTLFVIGALDMAGVLGESAPR